MQRKRNPHAVVKVLARSQAANRGLLRIGTLSFPCALGRSGARTRKREGDGATPRGRWSTLRVLYRADRLRRPRTALPVRTLNRNDGWCDASKDRNYNRPVRHPYPTSAERLWRADALYDLIVVLDYNIVPRVRGRGSAIFLHVAAPGFRPTEGCIAMRREHLLLVLEHMGPGSQLMIL
jgi:L,D-peptidoglycan transpeptidase YkuD (ErfK/YbiS/YcfS/YnhG family)